MTGEGSIYNEENPTLMRLKEISLAGSLLGEMSTEVCLQESREIALGSRKTLALEPLMHGINLSGLIKVSFTANKIVNRSKIANSENDCSLLIDRELSHFPFSVNLSSKPKQKRLRRNLLCILLI